MTVIESRDGVAARYRFTELHHWSFNTLS